MNLNRTEWLKAQDLLVQLVQILVPLAEEEAKSVSSFPKQFFVPPHVSDHPLVFRYPVRALKTTLHSAQEQVAEWIEQLPASKSKTQNPEQKTDSPPPSSSRQPFSVPIKNRGAEGGSRVAQAPTHPLSSQVQKLIDQVRDAIGTLCTSANIVHPKAAPLRAALLRIKPLIDEVIKTVSEKRKPEEAAAPEKHRIERETEEKAVPFPAPSPPPKPASSLLPAMAPIFQEPARKKSEPEAPRIDRIALPGVPFIPETRPLTPARKKPKKKESCFQRQTREKEEE